jgi:hypothetical protein
MRELGPNNSATVYRITGSETETSNSAGTATASGARP